MKSTYNGKLIDAIRAKSPEDRTRSQGRILKRLDALQPKGAPDESDDPQQWPERRRGARGAARMTDGEVDRLLGIKSKKKSKKKRKDQT